MSVVLPWGPPAVPQFCLCQGQCRVVATGQWGGMVWGHQQRAAFRMAIWSRKQVNTDQSDA